MSYFIFADGASRGNPGPAGYGTVCFQAESIADIPDLTQFMENPSKAYFQKYESLGIKTNNEAEYMGLIAALEECMNHNLQHVQIFMDSELVVKQMKKEYKVKNDRLQILWNKANILNGKCRATISHVRREKNSIADYLANLSYKS